MNKRMKTDNLNAYSQPIEIPNQSVQTNHGCHALILLLILCSSAVAKEIPLISVTSDAAPASEIRLVVDTEEQIQSFVFDLPPQKPVTFTLTDLSKGCILYAKQGYEINKLQGTVDPKEGGTVTLTYLSNGLTREYNNQSFEIRYEAGWKVMVQENGIYRTFTKVFMKARKLLGQFVGIEKVILE